MLVLFVILGDFIDGVNEMGEVYVIVFGEVLVDVFVDGFVFGGVLFNVVCYFVVLGLVLMMLMWLGDDEVG